MIRYGKDSSWESTSNLCKSPGVDKIDHNPSSSPCNWFFTWHSNHKGSRVMKSVIGCCTFITQSQNAIRHPFLRTRKPPGPQGCLMEKPLNFLHPLGNFEGCSRHHAPVLKRFVVLMSDHTHRSQRVNDAKKVPAICTKGKKSWEIHHDFSTLIAGECPSKDVLTWQKRNATLGYGAWKSDAVHHKVFFAGTLPVNRYHMNYLLERELRWNGTRKKTEEILLILTAMR